MGQRAAPLSAELEEVRERLPDLAAGRDAEVLHDRLTVEVGPLGALAVLAGELDDAGLVGVDVALQRREAAGVAGCAVAADELVEVAEQRARGTG